MEVTLSTGKKVTIREPTMEDRRACENVARHIHPTLPTAYLDDTTYNIELTKRLAGLEEKDINTLSERDFNMLQAAIATFYAPDKRRDEARKAFLETWQGVTSPN